MWPYQFVQPAFINGSYHDVCAICADELMHISAPIASSLLEAQRIWLELPEGRGYLTIQNWNRFYFEPTWFETKMQTPQNETKGFMKMITPLARFSYVHVFEPAKTPSEDLKYSVSILIPKSDGKGVEMLNRAIQEAADKGVEIGKYPASKRKALRYPLRDGDEEHAQGKRGPEYKGFLFFNASSQNQPGVVDANLNPIMDPMEFYSGCWGHADVNFFPYNQAGNIGVGAGLNNLMKKKDDDRLDGRMKAEDAFAEFAEAPSDDVPFDTDDQLT